ncbi:MAG: ISL3 family transposase [Bdellovibrionales bacterium]|nr:ISL3 family transposase [Bdellovibrionales bacterium]
MEEMTCEAVARLTRTNSKTLWQLDQWRCEYLKEHLYKLPEDLDTRKLSADEVHYRTKTYKSNERLSPFSPRRDIKFLTSLVCSSVSKVIACKPGRDESSLRNCLQELTPEQRKGVEFISIDMNPSYFKAIMKMCPQAEIAVDRFHLVQKLNEAFDVVRKQEYYKAKKRRDSFQQTMLSRGNRFMYLERIDTKSIEESNMLGKIKALNDQVSNAMILTDYFHTVLDQKSLREFRKRLIKWYQLVRQSGSKAFRKFSKLVRKYRVNIEAYIKTGLTTAISEGINNKIKVLKRMGYGYINEKAFQNKILQRCGFLNSTHLNTNFMMWHIPTPQ